MLAACDCWGGGGGVDAPRLFFRRPSEARHTSSRNMLVFPGSARSRDCAQTTPNAAGSNCMSRSREEEGMSQAAATLLEGRGPRRASAGPAGVFCSFLARCGNAWWRAWRLGADAAVSAPMPVAASCHYLCLSERELLTGGGKARKERLERRRLT